MSNCESLNFSPTPKTSKTLKIPSKPIEKSKPPSHNQQPAHDRRRGGHRPKGR